MSCGTHYDVIPVERGPPVPAISSPQAAPSRRSMAEAQEEPEEGMGPCSRRLKTLVLLGVPCKKGAQQNGSHGVPAGAAIKFQPSLLSKLLQIM